MSEKTTVSELQQKLQTSITNIKIGLDKASKLGAYELSESHQIMNDLINVTQYIQQTLKEKDNLSK
jgi:hypothetical protein